jgi:hypothetical protein
MIFDIGISFQYLSRKFKCHYNQTRMSGTSHEDQYTFLIILAQYVLEREMFQTNLERRSKHV